MSITNNMRNYSVANKKKIAAAGVLLMGLAIAAYNPFEIREKFIALVKNSIEFIKNNFSKIDYRILVGIAVMVVLAALYFAFMNKNKAEVGSSTEAVNATAVSSPVNVSDTVNVAQQDADNIKKEDYSSMIKNRIDSTKQAAHNHLNKIIIAGSVVALAAIAYYNPYGIREKTVDFVKNVAEFVSSKFSELTTNMQIAIVASILAALIIFAIYKLRSNEVVGQNSESLAAKNNGQVPIVTGGDVNVNNSKEPASVQAAAQNQAPAVPTIPQASAPLNNAQASAQNQASAVPATQQASAPLNNVQAAVQNQPAVPTTQQASAPLNNAQEPVLVQAAAQNQVPAASTAPQVLTSQDTQEKTPSIYPNIYPNAHLANVNIAELALAKQQETLQ